AFEVAFGGAYEWNYVRRDLSAALGPGVMTYADMATPGLTRFGTTDDFIVPHIGGHAAAYMHVPPFTGLANGYLVSLTGSEPNGGGRYINQYTFIADVLLPGGVNWMPFFNTDTQNRNDADFYVGPGGSLYAAAAYSDTAVISPNTWQRVALVANLATPKLIY